MFFTNHQKPMIILVCTLWLWLDIRIRHLLSAIAMGLNLGIMVFLKSIMIIYWILNYLLIFWFWTLKEKNALYLYRLKWSFVFWVISMCFSIRTGSLVMNDFLGIYTISISWFTKWKCINYPTNETITQTIS